MRHERNKQNETVKKRESEDNLKYDESNTSFDRVSRILDTIQSV